jgi:hypothetical protein
LCSWTFGLCNNRATGQLENERTKIVRFYIITEHHGRKIKERMSITGESPEAALRLALSVPLKPSAAMPPENNNWRYIDDGLGGGAIVDPHDENHCYRADPRKLGGEGHDGEAC